MYLKSTFAQFLNNPICQINRNSFRICKTRERTILMNRIRTIQGAADELRKRDPGCAITAHNIRQLVLHKEIPSRKAGSKYLVALDDVERYFGLTIDESAS